MPSMLSVQTVFGFVLLALGGAIGWYGVRPLVVVPKLLRATVCDVGDIPADDAFVVCRGTVSETGESVQAPFTGSRCFGFEFEVTERQPFGIGIPWFQAHVVDGDRQFGFEDRATTSGERYQRVEESETTTERYQAAPNATRYERLRMDSEANVDRMRDQIERDERQELLEAHRTEEHVTFIIATNGSDPTVDFADPAAVVVRSLHAVGYEPTGDASPDRIRYEPQAGWYGDTDGYRITNANGDIRVDASANTVESASVSWDVTEPADSYAQYVATSLSSSDPTTHEISFELQRDQPEVTQPSWSPDT